MPLGGLLPYGPGQKPGLRTKDDMDAPVVLDSGDLTDRVDQGADDQPMGEFDGLDGLEGEDEGILALIRQLTEKRGELMPGAMEGGMPPKMPEQNGQVTSRMGMPQRGGLGRALLSGFRG